MRTLNENLIIRMGGTPATWAAAEVAGNWVQLKGKGRRALLIVLAGELDADAKIEVYEATDVNGAGAQELTGVSTGETFHNGADEARVGLIELRQEDLSAGFSHVAAYITPGATDTFAAVWIISDIYEAPASNLPADGVAFNVGEG